MVHCVFQAGFLGSRRKSKGHNQQQVRTNSTEDVRKNSNPLPNLTRILRTLFSPENERLEPENTPLRKGETFTSFTNPPVFWGFPAVPLSFFVFTPFPKKKLPLQPPFSGDLGATTFAKGCSCSCRPQWKVLLVFMASIVSCRTPQHSSHNKHQKKHTKNVTLGSQNHFLQVLHDKYLETNRNLSFLGW